MAARVVIITGANSGVGLLAAKLLVKRSYEVILACRNDDRARQAMEDIRLQTPEAKLEYHKIDLADLTSVNKFVDWFLSTGKPLYALLNNGGIFGGEGERQVTSDGYEVTFTANHLGHFLLTLRLLDKLKSSVSEYGETRIVNVSSGFHATQNCNNSSFTSFVVKDLDIEDVNLEKPGAYNFLQAYKNSKAAQILFTLALERSLKGTGVTANACSPGFVPSTNVFRDMWWGKRLWFYLVDNRFTRGYFGMKSIDEGVLNLTDVVDDEKYKGRSGLMIKVRAEAKPSNEVLDVSLQNKMWLISCDMVKRPEFKDLLVSS